MDINQASRKELLRVPGLGPVTVRRVIARRKEGHRTRRLADIGKVGKLLRKAGPSLRFC